jgi:hypothetical protein
MRSIELACKWESGVLMSSSPNPLPLILAALLLVIGAALLEGPDESEIQQCIHEAQTTGGDLTSCR